LLRYFGLRLWAAFVEIFEAIVRPELWCAPSPQVLEDDIEYMARWLIDELWNLHKEVMETKEQGHERAELMREVRAARGLAGYTD
jgi:hypothetical protein